jgi:DeoR/GlpR family transcriptional regulator of sugar metabolism
MDPSSGRNEVFAQERQQRIARIVEEHGRARVAELAVTFDVSAVTIRKDLLALEAEGRVIRAHGGAIAVDRNRPERAFEVRERLQPREKDLIGAAAAGMVVDGESIALDASTTALAIARHLKLRGPWVHLTVVTNGLRIASELAGHPGITVALPGGFVRWEALSVVGPLGAGIFDRINVQKAFMGAAGFTLENGLSDATDEEAQIKRLMVGKAREVIAIVDHTKWQRAAFATFCRTNQLTAAVTDDRAPADMLEELRGRGIAVHVATAEDTSRIGVRSASSAPTDVADPQP